MPQTEKGIRRKLGVFDHTSQSGNISKTCRFFGLPWETFYQWKRAYAAKERFPFRIHKARIDNGHEFQA